MMDQSAGPASTESVEDPTPDELAPTPETEALDAAPDTDGGVWRCLNERCPDAVQGKTFTGPTQQTVQASGEHLRCPSCKSEPAPHYIYVADAEPATTTA